jgi:hypothetical protein
MWLVIYMFLWMVIRYFASFRGSYALFIQGSVNFIHYLCLLGYDLPFVFHGSQSYLHDLSVSSLALTPFVSVFSSS